MSLQVVGIGSTPRPVLIARAPTGAPHEEGTDHEEVWIIRRGGSDRRGRCGDVYAGRPGRHAGVVCCRFHRVRCPRYCGAGKSIPADHAGRPSPRFYEACKSIPADHAGGSAARSDEASKSISADHAGRPSPRSFEACESISAGDTGPRSRVRGDRVIARQRFAFPHHALPLKGFGCSSRDRVDSGSTSPARVARLVHTENPRLCSTAVHRRRAAGSGYGAHSGVS
jgi:hypothetical protein